MADPINLSGTKSKSLRKAVQDLQNSLHELAYGLVEPDDDNLLSNLEAVDEIRQTLGFEDFEYSGDHTPDPDKEGASDDDDDDGDDQ